MLGYTTGVLKGTVRGLGLNYKVYSKDYGYVYPSQNKLKLVRTRYDLLGSMKGPTTLL